MVLYHMAKTIDAELEIMLVRLGREYYNVQLRVTKDLTGAFELMNGKPTATSQSSANNHNSGNANNHNYVGTSDERNLQSN